MTNNRRGKFTISRNMLQDSEYSLLQFIMRDIIVLHTETNYATDEITYWVIHPDFETVKSGEVIPTYVLVITKTGKQWKKIS